MKINVSKCNYNICKACAIVSSIQKLILSFFRSFFISPDTSLSFFILSLFFLVYSFSLDPSLFRSFFLSLFLL